ncbi:YheC/YheD family protein [Heyndrickxia sp. NPDC080065]|uniref:YheC/YheD family protein n=1 Tax=Heyndrickxia sp. NPDC080065 TaxID=3390568 RepID=UPI003CFD0F6B
MSESLGKWKQNVLLKQNPLTANSIPETNIYTLGNLLDFINRYDYVYVKHDTSGQGRGIYKLSQKEDASYCFKGFTLQGKPINKCVKMIEDFHQFLHPFEKFGRLSGTYIIQEGIKSFTNEGLPFCIRVHVQNLKGKWEIGGMNGKIGTKETISTGIINSGRADQVISIDELFSLHLKMRHTDKKRVIEKLEEISINAAQVIASQFPCREYGIDFGLNQSGPILFEVNTTPGINGFGKMENKSMWKRIVEIRKLQSEG